MKNKLILLPLILLAAVCCYPVLFLLTGALMDSVELKERLGPVLGSSDGFVGWALLPSTGPSLSLIHI